MLRLARLDDCTCVEEAKIDAESEGITLDSAEYWDFERDYVSECPYCYDGTESMEYWHIKNGIGQFLIKLALRIWG